MIDTKILIALIIIPLISYALYDTIGIVYLIDNIMCSALENNFDNYRPSLSNISELSMNEYNERCKQMSWMDKIGLPIVFGVAGFILYVGITTLIQQIAIYRTNII